jgi:hypothetical protein
MKPELQTFSAIHPTLVKPCGYCGVMIEGYTKVVRLRLPSCACQARPYDPQDILLHPECVLPFAHWISEVNARSLV